MTTNSIIVVNIQLLFFIFIYGFFSCHANDGSWTFLHTLKLYITILNISEIFPHFY